MRKSPLFGICFVALIGLGLIELASSEVTHEEIRGTIQSLIYSYNQLDNKLERHEHRERALGELLKKGMQTLQKGQKSLEPINGIFGRLDERVSQIETMLIAQEDKYNIQTEKLGEALEHMFQWMRENNECLKRPPVPAGAAAATPTASAASAEFEKQQLATNKEMLEQLKKLNADVSKLLDANKNMLEHSEVAFKSLPSTAAMLTKIEDKLVSYSVATTPSAALIEFPDNSEFEQKVLQKFEQLNTGLSALSAAPKTAEGLTALDREFIQSLSNDTLQALEHFKAETLEATNESATKATARLEASELRTDNSLTKLTAGVSDSAALLQKFYTDMNASYSKLNESLEIFSKFNNIMMTNSEYVLDTQRKVEFSTHKVVQKISDLLAEQRNEVAGLLKERFDNIDESIVTNHVEAMQNLSALMESEISQVWHQIELMNAEVTDSKDLLNAMQGKADLYVNSTFATMGSMDDKVQKITGRMIDLETNLNFLLGRLSVMSQEFANIKTGLGEALDQIRDTFHSVQDKMVKVGPGPHQIPSNEYETELKLLGKRNILG